jgi:hypothetical protein
MSVLCGNCKTHHPCPADVKRCYGFEGSRRRLSPRARTRRAAARANVRSRVLVATPLASTRRTDTGGKSWSAGAATGLVHRPGAMEVWTGYTCEHCDAKVAGGSAHDCC